MLKKVALALATSAALAAEPTKVDLPNPMGFVDTGCVSFGVLHARADDQNIHRAMLNMAVELDKRQLDSSTWVGILANLLSPAQRQKMLLGFLPFQGIRLDYVDNSGGLHSANVVTVSGWRGLQGLFWNRLLTDHQGRPFPTKKMGRADVTVRREGAIARLDGTFYAFSDTLMAQRCLVKSAHSVPALYKTLDTSHDTYGILYNRQKSLSRFLHWMNMDDLAAVENAMGVDRFKKAMDAVEYLMWQGEVLDDDHLDLEMKVHVPNSADVPLVNELLTTARTVLKQRGRPTEVTNKQSTSHDIAFDMVIGGNRKFFLDYLTDDEPM